MALCTFNILIVSLLPVLEAGTKFRATTQISCIRDIIGHVSVLLSEVYKKKNPQPPDVGSTNRRRAFVSKILHLDVETVSLSSVL